LKKALQYTFPFTLIVILACSGAKENRVLEKIPVKEIKQRVNEQFNRIQSLEAEGTIAFDSPDMSNSGYIELSLRKPDSIYFKIEGPFGIDIASALITRKDFVYYNVQENKVIMGPTTALNIGAILRIKVSFDELINSFSGSFHFSDEDSDSIDAASENNFYVLQVKKDYIKKKYHIDPETYSVNNYSVFNSKGKIILDVNYSKFETESTEEGIVYFPDQVTIHRPDVRQTVWLYYQSKEINKNDLNFKIKYPKSAKIVQWN
jgi:outer membrane lipoprotein-sorting protein